MDKAARAVSGLRRTTRRGLGNNNKRFRCGVSAFNISLIMRKLTGVGTPRQAAAALAAFWAIFFYAMRKDLLYRATPTRMASTRNLAARMAESKEICWT